MNTGATMEPKMAQTTTPQSKERAKKIIKIVGACVVFGAGVAAVYWKFSDNPEPLAGGKPQGNDRDDLSGPRFKTGFDVVGTVTINKQFPLGIGYVIAYDERRSHAIASCALDKMGNYKLRDVTPGKLFLLVKREITDETNPVYQETLDDLGIQVKHKEEFVQPKTGGPMMRKVGKGETIGGAPPGMSNALRNAPSKENMERIRFEVSTPEFENMPEVKWMIQTAFMKFNHFSNKNRLVVPPGEGERKFLIDLTVP